MFELPIEIPFSIAIGLAVLSAVYYFLFGWGVFRLKQISVPANSQLIQAVFDRGQRTEYESLIALGFLPLGNYQESHAPMMGTASEFVFAHESLPASCTLNQYQSGVLSTDMVSHDANGRFMVTTNYDPMEVESDERNLFYQVDTIARVEDIFRAHFKSLDVWESDGFEPVQVQALEDYEVQSQQFWRNEDIRKKKIEIGFLGAIGVAIAQVGIPALLAWIAVHFSVGTKWEVSWIGGASIFSCVSLTVAMINFYSIIKDANGKAGKRPYARPSHSIKGFGCLPTAVGFVNYEFMNKAWTQRIKKRRWLINLAAGYVLLTHPVLVVISILALWWTQMRKYFAYRCSVSFNDHYLSLTKQSFLGSTKLLDKFDTINRLEFKHILYFDLIETGDNSVRLIAGYNDDPPDEEIDILGIKMPVVYKKNGTKVHTIVDSLWGFDCDRIANLYNELRQKRQSKIDSDAMLEAETAIAS